MKMFQFDHSTTAEEAAEKFSDQIDGKTVLVTGVSPGGIGLETARGIALHSPSLLILAARSPSKLAEADTTIKAAAPGVRTRLLQLDLSSFRTVRAAAEEVNSWTEPIDVLINNAGVMMCPFALSEDGIETQFATNHVGTFLFTNLVMGKILAARNGARIVNVSSRGHRYGPARFEDWNFGNGKDYDPSLAYGQSKTANMLFSVSLAEKLKSKGAVAFSLHPGAIWTNLGRHIPTGAWKARGVLDENGNVRNTADWTFKTLSQGASTTVVAAFDPTIAENSGAYLVDCQIDHGDVTMPYAVDKDNAERLWKLSENLVGQKFEY
ncbi:short-chain dehydrogenase [Cenococcum geophilum 1.58]|uniref:short-chain dehydrogenase n=1 Tax=Cenococcum geophilum 1.58 TaxID=794803 RepID=UPI00358FABF1|nr:short-chain dehydrogenase [Cenococcum geophilum 1.58]